MNVLCLEVTEEYISKTCTRCGHIHAKLGGSKKFKCPGVDTDLLEIGTALWAFSLKHCEILVG